MNSLRRALGFLCFFFAFLSACTSQAEVFRNPHRIPTQGEPSGINVVDLNGDGRLDIVYGQADTTGFNAVYSVHTLLQQANGSYLPGPVLNLPQYATGSCLTGDLDGDGRADLVCPQVVPQSGGGSTVLLFFPGNGDGSFGPPVYSPGGSSNYPVLTQIADVNHDGKMDVLVVDPQGTNYLMLGDGTGRFTEKPIQFSGESDSLADANNDGTLDIMIAAGPGDALGNGDGTFQPGVNLNQYVSCFYHDMDGDGVLDAICTGPTSAQGTLFVLHGNGDGSFNPTPISTVALPQQTMFAELSNVIAVRDVNHDGIPDLIGNSSDGIAVLLGGPGLTFQPPVHYAAGDNERLAGAGRWFVLEDLNGDGFDDLAMTGPNGIYISYGRPDGTFAAAPVYEVDTNGLSTAAGGADFNGDGIPDVVSAGNLTLSVALGRADGSFAAPAVVASSSKPYGSLLTADFNGDGRQDVLAEGDEDANGYHWNLLQGNGDGSFQPGIEQTALTGFSVLTQTEVADLNGDGLPDIVTPANTGPNQPSTVAILLNQGGMLSLKMSIAIPVDGSNGVGEPIAAVLRKSALPDLAYATPQHVYVLRNNGDGTFNTTSSVQMLPIPPPASGLFYPMGGYLAVGDFDGDGSQDLALLQLVTNSQYLPSTVQSTRLILFYGNGDGTFSAGTVAGDYKEVYGGLQAADVDQDGISDVVLYGSWNATGVYVTPLGVVHGLRNRTVAPQVSYFGGDINALFLRDINGDGFPDMIVPNGAFLPSNSVTVLMNLGNPKVTTGTLAASPEPTLVGTAFQLRAALSPGDPASTLSGTVNFTVDGTPAGSAPLAANVASVTVAGSLPAGLHSIGATWAGDANNPAMTLTGSHDVVTTALVTLTSSANPSAAGQSVTFTASVAAAPGAASPTGTVTFIDGGTVLGTVPLAGFSGGSAASFATGALTVGSHAIAAQYSGDTLYQANSAGLQQTVAKAASATILTAAPNPVYQGQALTLTAQVQAPPNAVDGSIAFFDGAALLGNAALANGTATLSTSGLLPGNHAVSAVYSGSVSLIVSTSNPVSVTVLPSSFSLSTMPGSMALRSGYHTMITLTAASIGAFRGEVMLSAASLPTDTTVQFHPASITLTEGGSGTVSVYIDTDSILGFYGSNTGPGTLKDIALCGLPVAVLLGCLKKRRMVPALLVILLSAGLLTSSGCTDRLPNQTPPGRYTLHLTGTSPGTGQSASVDLPMTVTK